VITLIPCNGCSILWPVYSISKYNQMKNLLTVCLVLVLSISLFSGCENKAPKTTVPAATTAGVKYICPMKCDNGKTYDKAGACPVCHMDLVVNKEEEKEHMEGDHHEGH
jgi:uncharacterized paraquat-inducible protein A